MLTCNKNFVDLELNLYKVEHFATSESGEPAREPGDRTHPDPVPPDRIRSDRTGLLCAPKQETRRLLAPAQSIVGRMAAAGGGLTGEQRHANPPSMLSVVEHFHFAHLRRTFCRHKHAECRQLTVRTQVHVSRFHSCLQVRPTCRSSGAGASGRGGAGAPEERKPRRATA